MGVPAGLNQATAKQGLTWSVGSASIGLFPIAVELEEVAVAHAGGTDFVQITWLQTSPIGSSGALNASSLIQLKVWWFHL